MEEFNVNDMINDYSLNNPEWVDFLHHGDYTSSLSLKLNLHSDYGIISKVEEIVPNKVIRVTFTNGDTQKAVCSECDDFDFERGIEVCICKHFLGGTKEFNKQLRQGLKCWDDACEAKMDRLQEEARIAKKKQKRAEQKQRRNARRAEEEREEKIRIQVAAILRANDIIRRGDL